MSVSVAVKRGRISRAAVHDPATGKCVGISDPELADRELAANSDHTRAPEQARRPGPEATADGPLTLMEASTRQKLAQAQLAEAKLAQIKGELLPAADVRKELEDVFRKCRMKLLGVPSRAVEALQLTPVQAGRLEALVREALEDLADAEGET